MSSDVAVDPQMTVEAGLPDAGETAGEAGQRVPAFDHPEEWREHVRELRSENARRRKENQELRAQLAALGSDAEAARAAQAAAAEAAQRDAARLATAHRRLKELELARLARQALEDAARAHVVPPSGGSSEDRVSAGLRAGEDRLKAGLRTVVDPARVERLLALVPAPVELDADLMVTDEGEVTLSLEASERLKSYAAEVAELASVEARPTGKMPVPLAPPPVGGEPPRPAGPAAGPVPNAWDPAAQRTPAAKARATLRRAAGDGAALDGLAQV